MQTRAGCGAVGVALVIVSCGLPLTAQERGEQVVARAREAIGGEARVAAIMSLSVTGTSRTTGVEVDFHGTDRPKSSRATASGLEILIVLPDKFLITRGGPGGWHQAHGLNGTEMIDFKRRRAESGVVNAIPRTPHVVAQMAAAGNRELLRYLVMWLIIAPERYGVRFSDAGISARAGEEMHVVEATGANDFGARLFFDREWHLVMVSYREPPASEQKVPETRVHLTDHRLDDGILFPHRMTFETGGQIMEWKISRFKVNPPLDPTRFHPR